MFRIVLILSADKDDIHFLRHLLKYLHKQHPFKSIGFDIKAIQSCVESRMVRIVIRIIRIVTRMVKVVVRMVRMFMIVTRIVRRVLIMVKIVNKMVRIVTSINFNVG